MPLQRQLPKLCLRGSIANITMANLTEEDRVRIDEIVRAIVNDPDMQAKRASIIRGLGTTIGWDYRDDRSIADQEWHIAVWRGVVNLFYHCKYKFRCQACGSSCYVTKRNKVASIDRQQLRCPNCDHVQIKDPGDSEELTKGQFLPYEQFQEIVAQYSDDERPPRCRSAIRYVTGEKFYDDPMSIINDPVQRSKFFGEYGWNYVRQQIRENERAEHRKTPRTVIARADEIILQELLAICRKLKLDFRYDPENYDEKAFEVYVVGLLTPPEFTAELALLRQRALKEEVAIETTSHAVRVLKNSNARSMSTRVSMPEHVMFQEENETDENGFTTKQISYRTIEGARMDQDDHVAVVDNMDVMQAIRDALPDGTCKAVFDIQSGQGQTYREFSDIYGNGDPRKCHMAEFLGVPNRTIGQCHEQIRVHCHLNGLTPTS